MNFFKYHPVLSMCIGGVLFSFLFVYGRYSFLNKHSAENKMIRMPMEMPTQIVNLEEGEKFVNFDFSGQYGNEIVVTEICDENKQTKTYKITNINTGRTIVVIEN